MRFLLVAASLVWLAACDNSTAFGGGGTRSAPLPADIRVEYDADRIVINNGLIEREWSRNPFRTTRLVDLRNGQVWSENSPDFALIVGGIEITSERFASAEAPTVETTPKGTVRVTIPLAPAPLPPLAAALSIVRTVEVYPDVAGLRTETRVASLVPLLLTGYTLDEARPAGELSAQIHAFRAGADWRTPEWQGPPLSIGDAQTGSWRQSTSGAEVSATAQWMSVGDAQDRRLFHVMERNDYASSMMSFAGGRARAHVDLGRDLIYLGPIEESAHLGNPLPVPARQRPIVPGRPVPLEPVFTGVALDRDDEAWQHHRYFAGYRMPPYRRDVTFNSNGVDDNLISTGAKDDLNYDEFLRQLPVAERMGIETFIFDDGWQARSGDWCPDADVPDESCHDPRRGDDPKFAARFPDAEFRAVQAELTPRGMNLGLWWTPLHFHPSAAAFNENPEWLCLPLGVGLLALNLADPGSSSSEAGIVQWNPEAISRSGVKLIDYIESRLRTAIDAWGVRYFKFDFTAWLDCAGVFPVDVYSYRESFMGMLDRLIADHPEVTIQMDETNDYRLFPFEALARGPTWYINGSPLPNESLHAAWLLSPYVPVFALGRNALRAGDVAEYPAEYQMAVALLSHMTFFNDLKQFPDPVVAEVRRWTDYYRAHREDLAGMTYPLLEEDPYTGDNWAAFQVWDPVAGRGSLLVFRQDSPEAARSIRLRNVAPGRYRLLEAPAETQVIEASAEALREGIEIAIPAQRAARVFRIERVP